MIDIQKIFDATNGGLDIILALYPQAQACVQNRNKHFAIRNEKTPSASLREYNSAKYGRIWQVTDFGGEGRGQNAVDLYMQHHGMDKSRFGEALLQLAARYGIKDELDRSVNKPDIRKVPAEDGEEEGSQKFELNEKMTADELRILGPRVTQENVNALHWYSVKWISRVKNREKLMKYSNEHYPIFMRECVISEQSGDKPREVFYKVYEPLNTDKGFRFSYLPAGKKPQIYINGLYELKELWRKFNAKEEEEWMKLHAEDGKPYRQQKLPEAVICSGERDSLCCRSMGFAPLWFNSETYRLSIEEYKEIMKYVEVLYNIPDLDETGRRKGRELALRFIDIHTIWLPDWLSNYRDHRGKPRKDLRDWMELRSDRKDFKNLMKLAMPARFWTSHFNDKGKLKHEIDVACLYHFLGLNGFAALKDENVQQTQFVRVQGNIVKRITAKEIREFVIKWVRERYEDRDILNLMLTSMRFSTQNLESLPEVELDFQSYTDSSQLFFFPDKTIKVFRDIDGKGKMAEYEPGADDLHNYVWEENVIPFKIKRLQPAFEIKYSKDDYGIYNFDIKINHVQSHFFGFLINSSRLYWRKEMEWQFMEDESKMTNEEKDAANAYAEKHRFDIAGEGLSDTEIAEQKQNLINKIFCFGYMLHRYKIPSRAWAPMAMDNKIGEENECNGRSGKSFFFKTLSLLMKTVKLSGRNPKLMDNPHVFDQVTRHTDMLLIDDCERSLNTGLFYDNITSDMTVNPKNNQSYTIPFEESPKLAFTSNYVPSDFDPSSEARMLYMVFSDYYHQKTEDNDYLDSKSIRDDFEKDLYTRSYTEDEWSADISFWLECCAFYLSLSAEQVKIMPPMHSIVKRKYKATMGANFEDWANGYFSREGGNLDRKLQRDLVLEDFKKYSQTQKITMQGFNRKLKAFVELCPWVAEINPEEMRNSNGRIQDFVEVSPGIKKTKDMIYLRSTTVDGEINASEDKSKKEDIFGGMQPLPGDEEPFT